MAYVEFAYEGASLDDLMVVALERIAVRLPGWTPNEASPEYALLSEMVREAQDTRLLAADVADSIFRTFGQSLIAFPALPGLPATANATFTFTDPTVRTIPAGTAVLWPNGTEDPVQFVTALAVTNLAGQVTTPAVQINASAVGVQANGLPVLALTLVDALAYVASVQATSVSAGGQDAETDAAYLDRLADSLKLLRRIPVLGPDFAILARDVAGVSRAVGIDNYQPGVNEQQTVTVAATGGTFTLTFEGQTTAAIAHNATSSTVSSALVALSNVTPGDVIVTGGPLATAAVTVEFARLLAGSDRTQMTATSSLTGTSPTVTVATARAGVVPVTTAERTVSIAPLAADGTQVSGTTETALQVLIAAERETNFVVNVIRPTYTDITVSFTGQVEPGADPAIVLADAIAAVKVYLSPVTWGGGDERPPVWRLQPTVRYLDIAAVIGATSGLRHVYTVVLNGGSADVTLIGPAPLPAPLATVTGVLT